MRAPIFPDRLWHQHNAPRGRQPESETVHAVSVGSWPKDGLWPGNAARNRTCRVGSTLRILRIGPRGALQMESQDFSGRGSGRRGNSPDGGALACPIALAGGKSSAKHKGDVGKTLSASTALSSLLWGRSAAESLGWFRPLRLRLTCHPSTSSILSIT